MIAEIVAELGIEPGFIANKKYGSNPEITIEVLIEALITTKSAQEASEKLGVSRSTLTRVLKRVIPKGDTREWHSYLLELIGKKECSKCSEIKSTSEFYSNVHYGNNAWCRLCCKIHSDENPRKNVNRDEGRKRLEYQRNNRDKVYAANAEYRARKLSASVPWANQEKIREFYANCPAGYEVDHIIPLRGQFVCGLHVETNLQYLLQKDNRSKSNKFNC